MSSPIPQLRNSSFDWTRVLVWLVAFISPTACCFLLGMIANAGAPAPPTAVIAGLFFLVPVAALIVCETVVWRSKMTTGWKIGGMLFTLLALLLQFGILLALLQVLLIAATSYA